MDQAIPTLEAGLRSNPTPGQGEHICGSCGKEDVYLWNAKGRFFPYQGIKVELKEDLELLQCSDCDAINLMLGDSVKLNEYLEIEYQIIQTSNL